MYCKRCGTKNKDDARFCANCGQKLVDEPVRQEPVRQEPEQQPVSERTPNQSSKTWIIVLACVVVAVVGIFGYQYMKSKDKKETATTQEKTTANTAANSTEENTGEDVADANDNSNDTEESQALEYTDNEYMDLSACTDSDDYAYVRSKDKSFGFSYPKYLFNHSYVNDEGNEYILDHTNGDDQDDCDIRVKISSQKAATSNPVKNVQKIYKQKKKSIKKVTFDYPSGGKTPKTYQGKSSMIVMGYLDAAKTKCKYVLVTSDGEKTYTMIIDFKDTDYRDEYKEINYVLDCMYRGCSFTNSSYQMRTFEQFQRDDRGQEK